MMSRKLARLPQSLIDAARRDVPLLATTLLAALTRLFRPGLYPINVDEVNLLYWSLRIGRYGEPLLRSNQWSSLGGFTHSPLTNYVYAIPYLVSPSPIVARAFTGLVGVATTVLLYLFVKRTFGQRAAIAAGGLFALSIHTVFWGRSIWNPHIGQVFIAGWLLALVVGYVEGRRGAQVASWLLLALATHAHPGNALLGVPALGVAAVAWWQAGDPLPRRQLLTRTLIGVGAAALTIIPWLAGHYIADLVGQATTTKNADAALSLAALRQAYAAQPAYPLQEVLHDYAELASGWRTWFVRRAQSGPGYGWPPSWADNILWVQTASSLLGAAGFIVYGLHRERWARLPFTLVGVVALWPLVAYWLSPIEVHAFYMMPITFAALVIQGVLLGRLWGWSRGGRLAAGLLTALIVTYHLWLLTASMRWSAGEGWAQEPLRAPMSTFRELVADWSAGGDHNALFIIDAPDAKYNTPSVMELLWEVEGEGYGLRVINQTVYEGIPLAGQGPTTLAALLPGETIPAWFGTGQPVTNMRGEPIFRTITLDAGDIPPLAYTPDGMTTFENGARILGIAAEGRPQPNQPWPVVLVWHIERADPGVEYKFTLRFVGPDGAFYGQHDYLSLRPENWRTGDIVLNPAVITLGDTLPPTGPLLIHLGMYDAQTLGSAGALDAAGNPARPFVIIPVDR